MTRTGRSQRRLCAAPADLLTGHQHQCHALEKPTSQCRDRLS